jgi:hypothetical protein
MTPMFRHIFRARTLYIVAGLWWLALLLFISAGMGRWFSAGSTAYLVQVVVILVSVWVPIVFAIWQGVHWALSRPTRKIEKTLGVEEDDTAGDSSGDLPAPLAALPVADVRKLANYRTLKTVLVRASGFSLAFGGLAIFTAVRSSTSFGGLVLVALAVLLLQQGLWLRRSTNPVGLVTGGVTLVALGLWTMSSGLNDESRGSSSSFLPTLGIWQIVWGAGTLRRFDDMRLRRLGPFEPNAEALGALDTLVAQLSSEHTKSAGGIVFTASTWVHSTVLIGRLTPRMAVFATERGDDLFVGDPTDTLIAPREQIGPDREFKASLTIGDHSFRGTVSPHSFERYQHWKSRAVV